MVSQATGYCQMSARQMTTLKFFGQGNLRGSQGVRTVELTPFSLEHFRRLKSIISFSSFSYANKTELKVS